MSWTTAVCAAVLAVTWLAALTVNGDLYLFSRSDELADHNIEKNAGNAYDKLHLFADSQFCLDQLETIRTSAQIGQLCNDYCYQVASSASAALVASKASNESTAAATVAVDSNANSDHTSITSDAVPTPPPVPTVPVKVNHNDDDNGEDALAAAEATSSKENRLNLSGVLLYYRNFVFALVSYLRNHQSSEESSQFRLQLQLSSHEMTKLNRFAESTSDAEGAALVQDITDVLKAMIVEVNEHKLQTALDILAAFVRQTVHGMGDSQFQHVIYYVLAAALLLSFYMVRSRLTWRKLLFVVLAIFFCVSLINNHQYLSQKKQLFKQQKLKEEIPAECKIGVEATNGKKEAEKGTFATVVGIFRYHLGYTATSRRCLEYQEALYLTSNQHNYVETLVYTVTESLRPVSVAFGESINQFYSAISKDLSFYEYIPLLTAVTIVLVTLIIFSSGFLSLLLFGYELNFFHLISFRKTPQHNIAPSPAQAPALAAAQPAPPTLAIQQEQNVEFMMKILTELKRANRMTPSSSRRQVRAVTTLTSSETASSNDAQKKNLALEFVATESQSTGEATIDGEESGDEIEDNNESLNESIIRNFELYKEKNSKEMRERELEAERKEAELKKRESEINELKRRLKLQKLQNMDKSVTSEDKLNMMMGASLSDSAEFNSMAAKSTDAKLVSIGLSKTIRRHQQQQQQQHTNGGTVQHLPREEDDDRDEDDDDEEDIYVILDEH